MRNLLICGAILLASGCASAPQSSQAGPRAPVDAGGPAAAPGSATAQSDDHPADPARERAWASLPAVYAHFGMRGAVVSAEEYAYGVLQMRAVGRLGDAPVSRIVNCGAPLLGRAGTAEVQLAVVTFLETTEDGFAPMTGVVGTARDVSGSTNTVRCVSTGWLELEIARLVNHYARADTAGAPAGS